MNNTSEILSLYRKAASTVTVPLISTFTFFLRGVNSPMTKVSVTMAFFVKLEAESQFNPTKELQELEDPAFKQTPFNNVKEFQWHN